ncbi:DUF4347 domain-containing protein [Belliella calami]|nr:DUF4347 domain-containing protein [Belliella calami]
MKHLLSAAFVFACICYSHSFIYSYLGKGIEHSDNTQSPWIYIDEKVEGKSQITSKISPIKDSDTIYLFSHGKPGQLLLENRWMDSDEIIVWLRGNFSLKKIKHINIYGCEFGKDIKGKNAVATLMSKLNITISASDDITGWDGDWVLEVGKYNASLDLHSYQYNLQCAGPLGDCDGDGISNANDRDSDNDGILDSDELECITLSSSSFSALTTAWQTTSVNVIAGRSYQVNKPTSSFGTRTVKGGPNDGRTITSTQFAGNRFSDLDGIGYFTATNDYEIGPRPSEAIGFANLIPGDYPWLLTYIGMIDTNGNNQFDRGIDQIVPVLFSETGNITFTPTVSGVLHVVYTDRQYSDNNNSNLNFDVQECNLIDTDKDGTPDYLDLDSDNDGCPDAIEGGASFTYFDLDPLTRLLGGIDANGIPRVISPGGQSIGSSRIATQVRVISQPNDATLVNNSSASFSVNSASTNSSTFENGNPDYSAPFGTDSSQGLRYGWQESTDDGDSWTDISNGGVYSGANTNTLTITDPELSYNGYLFRAKITHIDYPCETITNDATLFRLLPVDWLSFEGSLTSSNQAKIQWSTAKERDSEKFIIQRSNNTNSWVNLGSIAAQGDTDEVSNYEYLDKQPMAGNNYYRLEQVDFDGKTNLSKVIRVDFNPNWSVKVFPNPFTDEIFIQTKNLGEIHVSMMDTFGRTIFSNSNNVEDYSFRFDTKELQNGLYYLKIHRGKEIFIYKLKK